MKALRSTRLQAASDRWGARLPSRIVVLALMGGSSSTCRQLGSHHPVPFSQGKCCWCWGQTTLFLSTKQVLLVLGLLLQCRQCNRELSSACNRT